MKFVSISREKGHAALHQAARLHYRSVFQLVATLVEYETGTLAGWCITVLTLVVLAVPARAATWYVDNTATGANNGTSWTNAWINPASISGINAGDTIYISGGAFGSSQTYTLSSPWAPPGGNSGNLVYYKVGTDSLHNGMVIFNCNKGWNYFQPANYSDISGNVSNQISMSFSNVYVCDGVNLSTLCSAGSLTQVKFRYLDFGGGFVINPAVHVEFDHCKWEPINGDNRQLFIENLNTNDPTQNIIHDCIFQPVYGPSGQGGDDGIAPYSCTISNCYFFPQPVANYLYGTSQHPDMIQTSAGQVLVCNNWFQGMRNYGFYGEWAYSGSNMHVVNNVFIAGSDQAISIGGGAITASDILVANNLVIDCSLGIYVWGGAVNYGSTISNVRCYNNMTINSGANQINNSGTVTGTITEADDIQSFPTSGFVSYTKGAGTNNNFHLNSTATTAIGQGANQYAYFTFDQDGNPRQATGNWDIGPYVYGSISTNPVLSVQPSASMNFGSVLTNTTSYLTNAVQNSGGGTLTGTATLSSSGSSLFSIVSGGTYSLGANQSTNMTVLFSPIAVGSFTNTITFTVIGGNGTTGTLSGTGVATYPAPQISAISQSGSDVDTNTPGLQVFAGYNESYSGSATDPSGLPLSWQWIYTNATTGVSGSVLGSGTGAVTTISYTYPASAAGSTYVWKLRVSNGYSTSESDLTVGVEAPPVVAGSLTFQPSAANISGPFVLSSGYVSQSVTTGTNGGQLIYFFRTANSNIFAVEALVNAPNTAANSFYVNIDAPPTDPTNIWDLIVTTGWTNEIVTWRGNGTNDQMSIYPQQNFSLNAGLHQLIIEGREAGTELGPVTIVQLPQRILIQ